MGCEGELPSAPQLPGCEACGVPATMQCGVCIDLFLCDTPACYDTLHPRARDRESHRGTIGPLGTASRCPLHPDYKLHLVCAEEPCRSALLCLRCEKHGPHVGHRTVDLALAQDSCRHTLTQQVTALAAQRSAAEHSLAELHHHIGRRPAVAAALRLEVHTSYLVLQEGLARQHACMEEAVERELLWVGSCMQGEAQSLAAYAAKATALLDQAEVVRVLPAGQGPRLVLETSLVVQRMVACGQPLVPTVHPGVAFSMPVDYVARELQRGELLRHGDFTFDTSCPHPDLRFDGPSVTKHSSTVPWATMSTVEPASPMRCRWLVTVLQNDGRPMMVGMLPAGYDRRAADNQALSALSGWGVSSSGFAYQGAESMPARQLDFTEGSTLEVGVDYASGYVTFHCKGVDVSLLVPEVLQGRELFPAVSLSGVQAVCLSLAFA